MMKKYFLLTMTIALSLTVSAQDIEKLMIEYAGYENAKTEIIDSTMLAQSMPQNLDEKVPFIQKIKSIQVVNLEKCSLDIKNKFLNDLENYTEDADYKIILRVQENGDNVLMVEHSTKGKTDAVYFLVSEAEKNGGDLVIVKISGGFSVSDLTEMIDEQKRK